ncbi:catechol 2,3-dioxygenase-like lactoylglutathione lyase family enzyme [Pullulanibacillus pueri]|uniref:Glyoxalase n=1 Tax=Pullulanibacillus pueri TaxID=1437324 RepID=A0A8J2ZTE2_9BACL|nr:VOC family protein [Pullulanibacillus pueri]MBM7681797.1 catechol 2,3-dioxygenase-like lactoylglutathione lyase family enzyme [Pullulanibacillus pueri]GGH76124.1 glyoxalase [Pullulanibacillus pueri]
MIEIEGLHHVSLTVTDLEKAKHFYGEVLGLPEIKRPPFDFPGAWYQVGMDQLHLIVYPEAKALRKTVNIDSKDGHFAVRVKDYKKTLHYLQSQKVDIVEMRFSTSGFSQIFCADPDGNLIELNVEQKDLNV